MRFPWLTSALQALKIYIRSRSPLLSEKSAVLLHLEQLLERKTALTDLEAIELFEEALDGVLPDSPEGWAKIIGELRWQYVKSNPKDEEAGKKCFQSCLLQDDLDHARQVCYRQHGPFPTLTLLKIPIEVDVEGL